MPDDSSIEREPVNMEVRSDLLHDFKDTVPDQYTEGTKVDALEDAMVLWMATIQMGYDPEKVIEMLQQRE